MKRSIYIFSSGEIHRKQNTIYFQLEDGRRKYIPVENTKELLIFGEVSINKKLLEFLSQKEIILHFFNHHGYYVGSYYPREHYNSGYMVLKQAEFYLDCNKRIDLARRFVSGATANIKKVLVYYKNRGLEVGERLERIENLERTIPAQEDTEQLMAIEGNAREVYYGAFNEIIRNEEFEFGARTRRPPQNRLNALISFGNSLLYVAVLSEIYKTHLDPRIGFLHTCNFRRFTLNLDVAEIFKPIIIDRIIFTLINKEMIKPKHFYEEANGVFMNDNGRKVFVEEFDRRMETTIRHSGLGRNVSYRRLILLELYKLEKHLIEDEPYEPFVTRW